MALLVGMKTGLVCVAMLLNAVSAHPAELSRVYVDRQNVTIGDTFNLYIEAIIDAETELDLSQVTGTMGEFMIRDIKITREEIGDGRIRQINKLQTTIFDLGDHTIPSFPLLIKHSGSIDTLWTEQIPIIVRSILPDQANEVRDIKPPLRATRRWKQILLSYLVLFGLIAGSAASLVASLRRRDVIIERLKALFDRVFGPIARLILKLLGMLGLAGRRVGLDLNIVVEEPGLPPDQIAIKELDRIEALSLIDRGMIKEYYTLISEVVRRYLERRFHVPVMESTTTDTLDMLTQIEVGDQPYRLVESVLKESDLVKFAKWIPKRELANQAIENARRIVELTREKVETQMVGEK